MVVLGIDYGLKRIGVAASDEDARVAFALEVVDAERGLKRQFEDILKRHPAEMIVIGNPLGGDGKPGRIADKVDRFTRKMTEWFGIECTMWDERFTSVQAARTPGGFRNKGERDQAAAVIILQSYLDWKNRHQDF